MKLYLGNLSKDIDDAKLSELVKPFGKTDTAEVVKDRGTGQSKGFGFVEFSNDDEARAAVDDHVHRDLAGERAALLVRAILRRDSEAPGGGEAEIRERRRHNQAHVAGVPLPDGTEVCFRPFGREVHLPVGDQSSGRHPRRV